MQLPTFRKIALPPIKPPGILHVPAPEMREKGSFLPLHGKPEKPKPFPAPPQSNVTSRSKEKPPVVTSGLVGGLH